MKNLKKPAKKNDSKATNSVKKEPVMKKKILPPKLQAVLNNDKKEQVAKQNALDLHLEKSDVPQANDGKEVKNDDKKNPAAETTTVTAEKKKTNQPLKKSDSP